MSEWISIEDALPVPSFDPVWVVGLRQCDRKKCVILAEYGYWQYRFKDGSNETLVPTDCDFFIHGTITIIPGVTHWMPIERPSLPIMGTGY